MLKVTQKVFSVYVIFDLFLISLSLYFVYIFRYNYLSDIINRKVFFPNFKEYSFIYILWMIFIIVSFRRRGLYSTQRESTIPTEIIRSILGIFYTSILIGAIIFFAKYKFFSRQVFLNNFILLCILLPGWRAVKRLLLRRLISQGFRNVNVLIVGAGRIGRLVLEEIKRNSYWGFNVRGFLDDNKEEAIDNLPVLGKLKDFITVAKKHFIEEVIITIPSERRAVSELIRQVKKMRLGIRVVPADFEEPLPLLNISYLGIIPLLTYKERRRHPAEFALKRFLDFLVSLFLLIFLFPLFIVIAVLIKLESKGPVFYVQKRMGFKGKAFNFYKFRSMVKEADRLKAHLLDKNESKGDIIFKIKKDPRTTRIGRLLRRFSLDELPQIMNVLKGDMSLVGPRPFPVEESRKLDQDHLERFAIRPGITGLAQVRGRSDLSFYRWVKWDLWYVNNWSFGLDFLILLWTIPVVLRGRGAY